MESSKRDGDGINLWNQLLADTIKMEDKDSHVLVLGNYDCGKKSLVSAVEKLLGDKVAIESRNENSVLFSMKDKKNPGVFDYSYVSVRNPADESIELAKINFWVMSEKVSDEIIAQVLTEKRLKRFIVLIVLDFEKLSNLPEDLSKWFTFINQRVAPLFKVFDLKDMDTFRARLTDLVVNYIEPVRTEEGKILNKKTEVDPEAAEKLFVPQGVLNPNYGFPIILSMNKSDFILELRNERHPDDILEMVEYTLRRNAYPYAGSVIYTSAKQGTNLNVLADYFKYLFFSMPFGHPYNPSKDTLFIPIGFDNEEIVNTAYTTPSQKIFADVIPKKEEQKGQAVFEFGVKSNQRFLEELKVLQPQTARPSGDVRTSVTNAPPGPGGIIPAEPAQRPRFSREHRERILNVLNRGGSTQPPAMQANPPPDQPQNPPAENNPAQ